MLPSASATFSMPKTRISAEAESWQGPPLWAGNTVSPGSPGAVIVKLAAAAVASVPTKVWAPRLAGLYENGPLAITPPRQDGSGAAHAGAAA